MVHGVTVLFAILFLVLPKEVFCEDILADKLEVTSNAEEIHFDWNSETKTALVKVGKKWWLVFDKRAGHIKLPRDKDLPNGIEELKNLFSLQDNNAVTIFELSLSFDYEFKIKKNKNRWTILTVEKKKFKKKDDKFNKDDIVLKKIALIRKQWPGINLKVKTSYTLINIDQEEYDIFYTFVLTDEPDLGVNDSYENAYFKFFKSFQGAGFSRYSDKVFINEDYKDYILLEVLNSPKPNLNNVPIAKKMRKYRGYSEIFKPFKERELFNKIHQVKQLQKVSGVVDPFTYLERSWVELLSGNERKAISFLGLAERYFPGITHHPFSRLLKSFYFILDLQFKNALYELKLIHPTQETELLEGVARAALGDASAQADRLRNILFLYKNYPRKFKEEFFVQVIFGMLNAGDYKSILKLVRKNPSISEGYRIYYQYAIEVAKSALNMGPFSIINLRDMLNVNTAKEGLISSQLRAYIMFSILLIQLRDNTITTDEVIDRLYNIQLTWRGDYLEFMVKNMLTKFLMEKEEYLKVLKLLSQLKVNFIESFKARHLDKRIEEALISLFTTNKYKELSPLQVIAVFDEYKEFTPSTDDGIKIIKNVGDILLDLDLLDEASELLTKESMNSGSSVILLELFIKIAKIHVNNNNGQAALAILKNIPEEAQPEIKKEALNTKAAAYAVMGDLKQSLKILESQSAISALRQASVLLVKYKMWDEARDRLLKIIVKSDKEKEADLKMDSLIKLAMVNVLLEQNDENQVLKVTYKDFVEKQAKDKRKMFFYITDDADFTVVNRNIIEDQLSSLDDFLELSDRLG